MRRARRPSRKRRLVRRPSRKQRSPRQPSTKRGLFAVLIIMCVLIAAVAITGTLIAAFSQEHPAKFAAPLKIYPVAQEIPGFQCPPGTPGVMGQGACYQVTTGITIKRVGDIHVERARAGQGYAVSISLIEADGKALARLTRGAVGRPFAFTIRDRVIAAPRVDAPITEGRLLITGNLTQDAANTIVRRLKRGDATPVSTGPAPGSTPPATVPSSPIVPSVPSVSPVPAPPTRGSSASSTASPALPPA